MKSALGVASFNSLTLNAPGDGYELSASSGILRASPLSNAFTVVDQAAPCSTKQLCSARDGNTNGNGQFQTNATSGELVLSVNDNNTSTLNCMGYTSADPNVYEFGVLDALAGTDGSTGTITIVNPSVTLTGNANQILAAQQICFDSDQGSPDWTTASGMPASRDGFGGWIGLLPTCTTKTAGKPDIAPGGTRLAEPQASRALEVYRELRDPTVS